MTGQRNDRTNEGRDKPKEKNKRRLGNYKQMTRQMKEITIEEKDKRRIGQMKDRNNEVHDNGMTGQTKERT